MLSDSQIHDIIHARIPDAEIGRLLRQLSPETLDLDTITRFIQAAADTVIDPARSLKGLGAGVIDCSGTGGSGLAHFNISTAAAFVLAAGGLPVAKFGNLAMSGSSGSFDFLQALGFPLNLPVDQIPAMLAENKLVFLFAPQFYPGLGKLSPIRKALAVPTLFNFIGPLLNPVQPEYRLLGVSNQPMQALLSDYLSRSGTIKKALVVRSENCLDEFVPDGTTHMFEVGAGGAKAQSLNWHHNGQADFTHGKPDARQNARLFMHVIDGTDSRSLHYQSICLNAGAAFYAGLCCPSIPDGYKLAQELIGTGAVRGQFEKLRRSYAGCAV